MTQAVYYSVLLLIYLLCVVDFASLGRFRGIRQGARRDKLASSVLPLVNRWIIFQGLCFAIFTAMGELQRAGAPMLFHLANAIIFVLLVPLGIHWQLRTGQPVLGRGQQDGARRRKMLKIGIFITLGAVPIGVTWALFRNFAWTVEPAMRELLEPEDHSALNNAVLTGYLLISAAVTEEILFRHYFIARLTHAFRSAGMRTLSSAALAICATSAVFALAHTGMITPAWLKYGQTFILGASLGLCRVLLGTWASIALHLLFNGAVVLLAGSWVK